MGAHRGEADEIPAEHQAVEKVEGIDRVAASAPTGCSDAKVYGRWGQATCPHPRFRSRSLTSGLPALVEVRIPSTRHRILIAKALGLSLDELFSTEDSLPRSRPRPATDSRSPSLDEAVNQAANEIEALPASVRLEALSRIQLRIMQGVAEESARSRI